MVTGGLSAVAAAEESFAAFNLARTRAASASRSVAASLAAIEAMVSGDCCASADEGRGRRDELIGRRTEDGFCGDGCGLEGEIKRIDSSVG